GRVDLGDDIHAVLDILGRIGRTRALGVDGGVVEPVIGDVGGRTDAVRDGGDDFGCVVVDEFRDRGEGSPAKYHEIGRTIAVEIGDADPNAGSDCGRAGVDEACSGRKVDRHRVGGPGVRPHRDVRPSVAVKVPTVNLVGRVHAGDGGDVEGRRDHAGAGREIEDVLNK